MFDIFLSVGTWRAGFFSPAPWSSWRLPVELQSRPKGRSEQRA